MRPFTLMVLAMGLLSCSGSDKGISIHNTAPVVSFTNPGEGDAFELGEEVEFWAFVEDRESPAESLELEWVSDLQGLLEEGTIPDSDGMASHITSSLEEGVHTVTIKATDSFGRIGSDYMTVRIESMCLEYTDCDDDGDGYTEDEGDCDDADEGRHPDAEELYNEIDDDCDGIIDEGTAGYDDDGDGFTEIEDDCDDADASVSPDAEEIADGIDNDCDDLIDEGTSAYDDDGDGYSEDEGDCDDT
ncbi:MAG: putative metal-binding motif-containing protein, partial [Planctomycetota bacterium]|nr:putative metal-binding motif-containing protein [Planctomycetota bacterium]